MRKIKDIILKIIAWNVFFVFILSACLLDGESWIPAIVCIVTGAWLALFSYANNWFEPRR